MLHGYMYNSIYTYIENREGKLFRLSIEQDES